jgi:neutral ceramidase
MGYAKSGQDTAGIHIRLFARAFVLVDEKGTRICMVNTDLAMVSQIVKIEVSPFIDFC